MKPQEQFDLISDMLDQVARRENDFPIIDTKTEAILFPVLNQNGIRINWHERMATVQRFAKGGNVDAYSYPKGTKGYNGLLLHVNDHGNVTVYQCYANGNRKEIASQV